MTSRGKNATTILNMGGKSTVRIYVIHSFLSRLYFFLPILVLWFRAHGFTQFEVTILLSVFFLSVTVSEIPTGIFADRFGHRQAMVLCGLLQAAGVFLLAFPSSLLPAVLGEVLMGIGQAFYTGAKEAWLFNWLEQDQLSHRYQKDYAHSKLFEFVGMGLGSLIGGTIYVHSGRLPFFLTAVAFLGAAVVGCFLKEPRRPSLSGASAASPPRLLKGFREILSGTSRLKKLIGYDCGLFAVIFVFLVTLIQPYLKEAGLPLPYFGILFLFFHSSAMVGSLMARRVPEATLRGPFFFLLALSFCAGFAGLAIMKHPLSFLVVAALNLSWGLFFPTTSQVLNRLIPSHARATILSTQDFLQHLLFVILAPLLGLATDHWGLSPALYLLSGLALLTALVGSRL